ncbi:NnrU family protein [Marinomonas pollencensis]|uniref:Putative membrane protein n=1 Tax=Marinomonas pollencensis TaxID=491954 RepID=A0A3E0DTE8_9GAMM|nr:NnrU family protein [Marinomonas pollencensis]REG86813.1 putative membrane protein [Marinomonas pollencensis]
MWNLVIGLVIFFGLHSLHIFASEWRARSMAKNGALRWRMRFGLLTLLAIASIIMGYEHTRQAPIWLWNPPVWTHQIASLLVLVSFYFAAAALIPGTKLKSMVGHPFLLAVKLWAFAHLISNGTLADVVLFASFLVWSIVSFAVARRRDRAAGVAKPEYIGVHMDLAAFVVSIVPWFAMVFFLHKMLIGVSPLL